MARTVLCESGLEPGRVIGLGTVVETARLRASLSSHLQMPASDVWAFGVGTHDDNFVAIAPHDQLGTGRTLQPDELTDLLDLARAEAAAGARRVRTADPRDAVTMFPVVEGVVDVLHALACDRRRVLTVSVLDPGSQARLFYSVPCTLGRKGVLRRHLECLARVEDRLDRCRMGLLEVLREAGELQ